MRLASTLLLTFVPAALAVGQATSTAKKTTTHRTTAASSSALPASIPRVPGIPKTLYALKYIDIKVGTGPLAESSQLGRSRADSKIEFYSVKYTGWLAKDGTKFDSSYDHPGAEPINFPFGVHQVIPGWDTGFDGMHVGGKRRLFIPYQLAYGESGRAPVIPAKADLIFDIELVGFSDKPPAPATPPPAPQAQPQATPQPAAAPGSTAKPAADPDKVNTDPATNNPAKATTPDNATKPAPKPGTNPPGL